MKLSISQEQRKAVFSKLTPANQAFNLIYKGDRSDRQPIQTIYQGADKFQFDIVQKISKEALNSFLIYAPDFIEFGKAFQLKNYTLLPTEEAEKHAIQKSMDMLSKDELARHHFGLIYSIYYKVIEKLKKEAVEDYRIDFEDGFGSKTNLQEDETAVHVGHQLVKAMQENTLPYYIGIRVKSFTDELKERSIRTIDLVLSTILESTNGVLPDNFVIMLPKVTITEQVTALCSFLSIIEKQYQLPNNSIRIEMMVEATQAVMDHYGTNPLYKFIEASEGRCHAMHFGTYDYTAACGITAVYQEMDHPVCDFAHHMTKVALAHTGIWLSDGATNIIPVGPYKGVLSVEEYQVNKEIVHAAWLKGYQNIRHSLWNGFYQGWDLYPSQLSMRYAAVFAFFLESYENAVKRMSTYLEQTFERNPEDGMSAIAEDAATGQALLNFFLKALNSGAISEEEIMVTGLTKVEIHGRSFSTILKNRVKK